MDDQARTTAIEARIDRTVAGGIPTTGSTGAFSLVPRDMGQAMEFGKLMSVSGECVRKVFRGNPGACLAIALQAWRDGADPFAYANHAYLVNDQIAFEAKLVQAIVNTRAPLQKRLRTSYSGEGATRRCIVSGLLVGEDEPLEYESPKFSDIQPKNSPLWKTDPDQQLHYLSVRAWARRWVPEVLLGIYTPDEIEGQVIDVTADRIDAHAAAIQQVETPPEPATWDVVDHVGEVHPFKNPETAVEACRRILLIAAASAADPKALATAWDNNTGLLDDLRTEGHGAAADALVRLHAELAPQETRPDPIQEVAPAERNDRGAPETPVQQRGDTGQAVEGHSDPSPPAPTPEPEATPAADMQREVNRERMAERVENPPAAPGPMVAQTDDNHDPFWDRQSLRIDPSPVRGGGSLNKLEWKTWPALILPKLRQIWKVQLLNAFWQDNADNVDAYGAAQGERAKDEIMAEFDAVRGRLSA